MLYYPYHDNEVNRMAVQYNKLWKRLIDMKIKKSALTEMAGVSASTIAKLSHDEYVSLEILERICRALHCEIGDVVELSKEAESCSGRKSHPQSCFAQSVLHYAFLPLC